MNIVDQIFGRDRLTEIGNAVALKWADGSCTYQQLADNMQTISVHLAAYGIKNGQRVVFQCSETPEFIAWYFSVLNIGAVGIAVSTRLSADQLAYVIQDSDACAVVFDTATANTVQAVKGDNASKLLKIKLEKIPFDSRSSVNLKTALKTSSDEALWVYSSGSTSQPKGIVHTHQDILGCSEFHLKTLQLSAGDLVFCTSKISFAYALANGLLAPLRLGATVFLHPEWVTLEVVAAIIQSERPRVVFAVPSVFRGLLENAEDSSHEIFSIPECYASAGEHLPGELRARWKSLSNRIIINTYGCSETLFLAFAGNLEDTPLSSVGKPLPGVYCELLDASSSAAVPQGEEGVLHLTHPFMFSSYTNYRQETKKRLKFGSFNTGDFFRQDDDGNWFHLGREDDLIKVAGQWVYLREIEKVGEKSSISLDVAVISAKDDIGSVRPALFFVPENGIACSDAVSIMREHLDKNLPMLKRPSWIRAIEDIPKTANGKISRSDLKQIVEGVSRDGE